MADTARDRITRFFQKNVANRVMRRMPFRTRAPRHCCSRRESLLARQSITHYSSSKTPRKKEPSTLYLYWRIRP